MAILAYPYFKPKVLKIQGKYGEAANRPVDARYCLTCSMVHVLVVALRKYPWRWLGVGVKQSAGPGRPRTIWREAAPLSTGCDVQPGGIWGLWMPQTHDILCNGWFKFPSRNRTVHPSIGASCKNQPRMGAAACKNVQGDSNNGYPRSDPPSWLRG